VTTSSRGYFDLSCGYGNSRSDLGTLLFVLFLGRGRGGYVVRGVGLCGLLARYAGADREGEREKGVSA
jgi:hypothetical protein